MADAPNNPSSGQPASAATGGKEGEKGQAITRSESALVSEHGTTTIADNVVAKVAGMATREVSGIHDLGGGAARAIGGMTQRVGLGDQLTQGVSVEVGTREAAIDLTVVIEYGESIPQVTTAIRQNVVKRISGITGLEVAEVNINVADLHFAGEDDGDQDGDTGRVQ